MDTVTHKQLICGRSPSVPLKGDGRLIIDELCFLPPNHNGECKFGRALITGVDQGVWKIEVVVDPSLKPGEWRTRNEGPGPRVKRVGPSA